MFSNPDAKTVSKETKMKFLRGLQKLDEQGIKDLDHILDSQGGFTKQAAERFTKDFGGFNDADVLYE